MTQVLLAGFVETSLTCMRCHEPHTLVVLREEFPGPDWKCDRCRVRETRKRAPWRLVLRYEGTGYSGPAGGERLYFELECGHVATRIPYERYWHMKLCLRNQEADHAYRPRLRCYECDPEGGLNG